MFYNVLNYLLFIEIFQFFSIFTPFPIVWTVSNPFGLIYDVGDLFECRFSRWIEPFMQISGIMSKLAYRLGFITVCILHDLMTVSL